MCANESIYLPLLLHHNTRCALNNNNNNNPTLIHCKHPMVNFTAQGHSVAINRESCEKTQLPHRNFLLANFCKWCTLHTVAMKKGGKMWQLLDVIYL